jgi:hypothetical protein
VFQFRSDDRIMQNILENCYSIFLSGSLSLITKVYHARLIKQSAADPTRQLCCSLLFSFMRSDRRKTLDDDAVELCQECNACSRLVEIAHLSSPAGCPARSAHEAAWEGKSIDVKHASVSFIETFLYRAAVGRLQMIFHT